MPVRLTNDLGIQPPEKKKSVLEALAHQQALIGNKEGAEFLLKTRDELLRKAEANRQPSEVLPQPVASAAPFMTEPTSSSQISPVQSIAGGTVQTDFMFELPKGYVDANGTLHRQGGYAPGPGDR
jgi:hypothetical protein